MTRHSLDKIREFRTELYTLRDPLLFKNGAKGLAPLGSFELDGAGKVVISVERIIRFFINTIAIDKLMVPEDYLGALGELLRALGSEARPFSFDCGVSVSEKDIQEADTKTTIHHLTKNIIISYFNRLKGGGGDVDGHVVSEALSVTIQKSNAGRDYRSLVETTLKKLIAILGQDKAWREYLEDINDADLVCRLTGAKLPRMGKEVVTGLITKSRQEIQALNQVYSKLLDSCEQVSQNEQNEKKYLKSMAGFHQSMDAVLKKIDDYLGAAHILKQILGLSTGALLESLDQDLKANMVHLLFRKHGASGKEFDISQVLTHATARHRMNILFQYPHIATYCRELGSDPRYKTVFHDFFILIFTALVDHMDALTPEDEVERFEVLSLYFKEAMDIVQVLGLDEKALATQRAELQRAYTELVARVGYEQIEIVLSFKGTVAELTGDKTLDILTRIREILLSSCIQTLDEYAAGGGRLPMDTLKNGIKKRLHNYALHYKPQRSFYRLFFIHYVGREGAVSNQLMERLKIHKQFILALLTVLSESQSMGSLLYENQMAFAASLVDEYQ